MSGYEGACLTTFAETCSAASSAAMFLTTWVKYANVRTLDEFVSNIQLLQSDLIGVPK